MNNDFNGLDLEFVDLSAVSRLARCRVCLLDYCILRLLTTVWRGW